MGDESNEVNVTTVTVEHGGEVRMFRLVEARRAEALLLAVVLAEPRA
jgi:hypothetical protein